MAETRWLSPEQQQTWRSFLAATQLLIDRLDHELQQAQGIPLTYYEILVKLSEAPGLTMRMSDLAASCLSSRSRLSHAVQRLEDSGWVRREDCPTDRRGAYAVLTQQGLERLEAAAPGHVAGVRKHFLGPLTAEQEQQLREICQTLAGHLSATRT